MIDRSTQGFLTHGSSTQRSLMVAWLLVIAGNWCPTLAAATPTTPEPRKVIGYGGTISITTRRDGEIDLLDENVGALYSTDAVRPDKHLTKLGNVGLRYVTEQGDLVTIFPNGDRSTSTAGRTFQIRESVVDGKRVVRDFGFKDGPMKGSWIANEPGTWRHAVDKRVFRGNVELVDFKNGEYRITDADSRLRTTYRRDGYRKSEVLHPDRDDPLRYDEKFGNGHRVEWKTLTADEIEALKLKIQRAEEFRISTPAGTAITITEAVEGETRYPVHAVFPGGRTWTRLEKTGIWSGKNAVGKDLGQFFGLVERVGYDTARMTNAKDHQVLVYSPDGTIVQTLLEEQSLPTVGLRWEAVNRPAYTITYQPSGRLTLQDWAQRRVFASDASDESDRLTVDSRSGDLSFFEQTGMDPKITIHPDGSRRIELQRGAGPAFDLTMSGGLRRERDAKREIVAEYGYGFDPPLKQPDRPSVYLNAFQNHSGSWEMTRLANDKQQWMLISGANGATVALDADRVLMSRANSFIIDKGDIRTIRKLDGTEITRTTSNNSGTRTIVTSVGSREQRDTELKVAYSVTRIVDPAGVPIRDELKSRSGLSARGGKGVPYDQAPWYELDADGNPKPAEPFYGDIRIDDEGTLIKQQFQTVSDPERMGQKKIVSSNDESGTPVPRTDNTHQLFTTGDSVQRFADTSVVYRDKEGDVQRIEMPSGQLMRYEYRDEPTGEAATRDPAAEPMKPASPESKPETTKVLTRFEVEGKIWTYKKEIGHFVTQGYPPLHPASVGSATNISIDSRPAKTTLVNIASRYQSDGTVDEGPAETVELDPDGSTHRKNIDGTEFHTRRDGRLTRLIDRLKTRYDLEYGPDGRLLRVDVEEQEPLTGKLSVIDQAYVVPSDRPLHAENVVGSELELRGWGDEKYVTYRNDQENAVRHWPDGLIEERDFKTDQVLRVRSYDGFVVERQGLEAPKDGEATMPEIDRFEIAASIAPVTGEGFDKTVFFVNAAGERVERCITGVTRRYGSGGRLKTLKDRLDRLTEFEYVDDDTRPIRIQRTDFELRRDRAARNGLKTMTAEAGQASPPVPVADFWCEKNGDIVVEYAAQPEPHVRYELFAARDRTRVEVRSDATFSYYFDSGRIRSRENAARLITDFRDEGDAAEPVERRTIQAVVQHADPSSVEFEMNGEVPVGLTRKTKGGARPDSLYRVSRREDGKWIDTEGGVFDSFWIAPDRSAGYLTADQGRLWSVMHADGTEIGVRLNTDYLVLSRVFRNVHGEATSVFDSALGSTSVGHNADGEITGFHHNVDEGSMFKVNYEPNAWELSCEPGTTLRAAVTVGRDGTQTWTSLHGVKRVVTDDATVEVFAIDGSRTIHPRDQSFVRYIYAAGNDVQEVTLFKSGDVELVFDDNSVWRREAYTNLIVSRDSPARQGDPAGRLTRDFRGRFHVSEHGKTTFYDEATRDVTVFHPDGRTTRLKRFDQQGWVDLDTNRIYENELELDSSLNGMGATSIHRHDNAYSMSKAAVVLPSLFLAMDQLIDPSDKRPLHRSDADDDRPLASKAGPLSKSGEGPAKTLGQTPAPNPESAAMPKPGEPATKETAQRKPVNYAELPGEAVILVGPAKQGDPLAQFELGKWFKEHGQLEEAKEWLHKASPVFPPAKALLKEVEAKLAQPLPKSGETPETTPGKTPAPMPKPGEPAMKEKAQKKPVNYAELPGEAVILVDPAMKGDSLAQFELGKWFSENGNLEEAKEWLQKASRRYAPAKVLLKEVEAKLKARE